VFLVDGVVVSRGSNLQHMAAQSATKSKHQAVEAGCKEALRPHRLRRGFGLKTDQPTMMNGDTMGSLALVKNPVLRATSKHIDVHHHAVMIDWIFFVFCFSKHIG
jgi:hypothetical protein